MKSEISGRNAVNAVKGGVSPVFPTSSGCSPAASSRLPQRSGSSRRLSPDAGAGTERRLSGCVSVSWRKGRGGAGCPGTRRCLEPETKAEPVSVKVTTYRGRGRF